MTAKTETRGSENETGTDTNSGGYSKRRLIYIAVFWFLAGAVVFAMAPTFTAYAQDIRGCSSPPCMFPAQSNVGGIVLGTENINAQNLIAFGVGDTDNVFDNTPPVRVLDEEEGIRLGTNDVQADNFFIYKSWNYFDPTVGNQGGSIPVYIWADAETAFITGSSACGDGTAGTDGSKRCDLVAGTAELSTLELSASADCNGLAFDFICGLVPDTFNEQDFWTAEPHKDECGELGALSGTICLGLIGDEPVSLFGVSATVDNVDAVDFMIRSHNLRGVPGDQNVNKLLELDNAYFEIRYGKGEDRINTPDSPNSASFAQPITDTYGDAALANPFLCEGGGPTTFCLPPDDTVSNIDGMQYDNIHSDPVGEVDPSRQQDG